MPPEQHGRKKNKTFGNILIGFSFSPFCFITGHLFVVVPKFSVSFALNISTITDCQQLTVGREAHISACANKAFTLSDIPMDSTEPSWRSLTRSTSITQAHITGTRFYVCLVRKAVSAVRMQVRAWRSTTGLSGQQQFHYDWLFQVNI